MVMRLKFWPRPQYQSENHGLGFASVVDCFGLVDIVKLLVCDVTVTFLVLPSTLLLASVLNIWPWP